MAVARGSGDHRFGTSPRGLLILAAPVALAGLAAIVLSVTPAAAAPDTQRFPARHTSGRANCSAEPSRPVAGQGSVYGGRSGGGFPIVGSIDANGCDSWTYEHAGSFGPDTSFFAGSGFQAGQRAYQDSTQETTELHDGHQLIRVVDPTQQWLRVYKGYDVCSTGTADGGSTTTCLAPAPEALPDDWVAYIPVALLLGAMAIFLIHFLRPAGPVRRPRHYRRAHQELSHATPRDSATQLEGVDIRQLQKRLRRLERSLSSELSESQRHWFSGLIASGRHGMALESLARWLAESRTTIPDHARDEAFWLAGSLKIEREVRPVLDAQVFAHEDLGSTSAPTTGFDIPLDEFTQLVSEAVDSLPPAFGKAMTNVAIVIEEEHEHADRLGQYQGHPLAAPRYRTWLLHPDKITIYRRTICQRCHSRDEVTGTVYRVVIHEIAHHFGIDDPRLRDLGW